MAIIPAPIRNSRWMECLPEPFLRSDLRTVPDPVLQDELPRLWENRGDGASILPPYTRSPEMTPLSHRTSLIPRGSKKYCFRVLIKVLPSYSMESICQEIRAGTVVRPYTVLQPGERNNPRFWLCSLPAVGKL